jgi:hypothetical protein
LSPPLLTDRAREDAAAAVERMRAYFRSDQIIALAALVVGAILAATKIREPVAVAVLVTLAANILAIEWCHRRIDISNFVPMAVKGSLINWVMVIILAPMVSWALPVVIFPVSITLLAVVLFLDRLMPEWVADTLVVVGVVGFTVPLSFLAWDLFVRQQATVERLAGANEALRASRSRLVAVADEERQRMERDLHDGAQQSLVALMMRVRLMGGLHPEVAEDVDAMAGALSSAIDELRDLAHGIYPPLLESQGLGSALESALRRSPLPCSLVTGGRAGTRPRWRRPCTSSPSRPCSTPVRMRGSTSPSATRRTRWVSWWTTMAWGSTSTPSRRAAGIATWRTVSVLSTARSRFGARPAVACRSPRPCRCGTTSSVDERLETVEGDLVLWEKLLRPAGPHLER